MSNTESIKVHGIKIKSTEYTEKTEIDIELIKNPDSHKAHTKSVKNPHRNHKDPK